MNQLSRPFQIALVAVLVIGAAWLLVLRPHGSTAGSTPATAAAPPPAPTTSAPIPAAVHGPTLPGVKGLTHAIERAHGAVTLSQRNAADLQRRSAEASSSAAPAHAAAAHPVVRIPAATPPAGAAHPSAPAPDPNSDLSGPLLSQVRAGRVGVLLFYDPAAADDQAVRRALVRLGRRDGRVAVQAANVSLVARYGAITRGVPVLQSPTVLVIDPQLRATTITGLTTAREIQQAVGDAVRAAEHR